MKFLLKTSSCLEPITSVRMGSKVNRVTPRRKLGCLDETRGSECVVQRPHASSLTKMENSPFNFTCSFISKIARHPHIRMCMYEVRGLRDLNVTLKMHYATGTGTVFSGCIMPFIPQISSFS